MLYKSFFCFFVFNIFMIPGYLNSAAAEKQQKEYKSGEVSIKDCPICGDPEFGIVDIGAGMHDISLHKEHMEALLKEYNFSDAELASQYLLDDSEFQAFYKSELEKYLTEYNTKAIINEIEVLFGQNKYDEARIISENNFGNEEIQEYFEKRSKEFLEHRGRRRGHAAWSNKLVVGCKAQ